MKRAISITALIGSLTLVALIEQWSQDVQRSAGSQGRFESVMWTIDGAVLAAAVVIGAGLWLSMRYGEQSRWMSIAFVIVGLAVWLASTPPLLYLWVSMNPSQFPRTILPNLSALTGSLVTLAGGLFATYGVLNLLRPPGAK